MVKAIALVTVIGTLALFAPARAEFRGTLQSTVPVVVIITTLAGSPLGTAVTILYFFDDRPVHFDVFSVPGEFGSERVRLNLDKHTTRVIVEVDPPQATTAAITFLIDSVPQGELFCDPPLSPSAGFMCRYTFDVR